MSCASSQASSALPTSSHSGTGTAGRFEQLLGQVFVFADAQANGAGLVGFRAPDAPLRCAVAQLHQIAIVQADKGMRRCATASTMLAVLGPR